MNTFISFLPVWAQEAFAWVLTGSNLVTILGLIAALFKISGIKKQNNSVSNTQIGLLQTMTDKLSDTRNLAGIVQSAVSEIGKAIEVVTSALDEQRTANANLAMFIMECFNKSNLSAEAKAELQVMADKIFFNDNSKVIEVLKDAKVKADAATADALLKIDELQKELEAERAKLALAQENVKTNRRV